MKDILLFKNDSMKSSSTFFRKRRFFRLINCCPGFVSEFRRSYKDEKYLPLSIILIVFLQNVEPAFGIPQYAMLWFSAITIYGDSVCRVFWKSVLFSRIQAFLTCCLLFSKTCSRSLTRSQSDFWKIWKTEYTYLRGRFPEHNPVPFYYSIFFQYKAILHDSVWIDSNSIFLYIKMGFSVCIFYTSLVETKLQ